MSRLVVNAKPRWEHVRHVRGTFMQLDVGQAKGMSSTEKALADYLMKKKNLLGDLQVFAVNVTRVTRVSVNVLFDLRLTGKLAFPVVQQETLEVFNTHRMRISKSAEKLAFSAHRLILLDNFPFQS